MTRSPEMVLGPLCFLLLIVAVMAGAQSCREQEKRDKAPWTCIREDFDFHVCTHEGHRVMCIQRGSSSPSCLPLHEVSP